MEDSQEKDYSFLGNNTFPNLYDALVAERKFKSEHLERQIYERLLQSEPASIVKLIENKSDLSKHIFRVLEVQRSLRNSVSRFSVKRTVNVTF